MGVNVRVRPSGAQIGLAASIALVLGVLAFASTAAAAPRIVYHSGNSPAGLWAMGVDGSSPKPFLANASGADFSGDGTKLV
jgi:hypothetical protein